MRNKSKKTIISDEDEILIYLCNEGMFKRANLAFKYYKKYMVTTFEDIVAGRVYYRVGEKLPIERVVRQLERIQI